MTDIFISYSHSDREIVDQLRSDLKKSGVDVWVDHIGLQPGTPDWDQAVRDAIGHARAVLFIASPSSRRSEYVRDELGLARAAGKPVYPAWVDGAQWLDCVPLGWGSTQYVDVRASAYADGVTRLVEALQSDMPSIVQLVPEAAPPPAPPAEPRNPYKGLRPFRAEDRPDFFGREALAEELITTLGDSQTAPRLLGILGASGSGKSSVVMAGLLPRLQEGAIPGSETWVYLDPMVPGSQPLEKLTMVLARQLKRAQTEIRKDLDDKSRRGLHRLAGEISEHPVVLYIDQFEELFALTAEEEERRQFIDLITAAACEPCAPISMTVPRNTASSGHCWRTITP